MLIDEHTNLLDIEDEAKICVSMEDPLGRYMEVLSPGGSLPLKPKKSPRVKVEGLSASWTGERDKLAVKEINIELNKASVYLHTFVI